MKPENILQIRNSTAEFLIFTRQAGEDGIEVRVEDETVWLTQNLTAPLFGVDVQTVSEHLGNLFDSGESRADSVIRKFRTTAADGQNYDTQFHNQQYRIVQDRLFESDFDRHIKQALGEKPPLLPQKRKEKS